MNRRHFLQASIGAGLASSLASAHAQGTSGTPIRIGQIGASHAHAAGKLATIRKSPEYQLVGVAESDPERRARAERDKAYDLVPWMTEQQLLASPGLQAVAVETTVKDLVATGLRCVMAGKHIHLDKPGGESLPAFKRLLDEATKHRLTVQMGYMLRYNPAFQLLFKLVREGVLGEVFSIDAQMSKLLPSGERKQLLPYRGGSMFELGCHVIDAVVTVLGRPQKVAPYNRTTAPEGDKFLDNQLAVLEYPKATVTVRSAMAEVEGGARRQFVVCGTKGTFEIRPLESGKARLALTEAAAGYRKGYQDITFPSAGGRYDGEFADLAAVIRGEKQFAFTPEHDLAVQETVLLASGLPLT